MLMKSIDTKCVQAGYDPKNGEPRVLPIVQSTTYVYETPEAMGDLFDLKAAGYFYTRIGNPTNAADLAHHLIKLLDTEEYGVYHGTGEGECSWYEFTKEIVALSGIDAMVTPCTTDEYPTPAKRPAYSSLENMMFKTTVGNEFRPWREALKVFIENNSN